MRRHTVEEEDPVEVVELVEQGAGLEGVGLDHAFEALDGEASHHDGRCSSDVAGEVGDAHAPFTGDDGAVGEQHLGVEQHDLPVA